MSNLTLIERARVMRMAMAQVRRRSVAGLLGSPLLRWRYGAPIAEALTMVPQELRLADPSFHSEIAQGQFGLARSPAYVGNGSPYDITPPNDGWARELHGFGWLRHLTSAASDDATAKARVLVKEWIGYGEARHDVAWQPDVTGRRIISWLSNAGLLLENVDESFFDRTSESLVDQLISLSAAWGTAPDGYPRLEALLGVVYGDFCIVGHEKHLAVSEARLAAELTSQVLPDGGHISRNSTVLLELMLDLLPLRQCYTSRKRKLPEGIDSAITRMSRMLRFMRLGDGTLARFNGVGATSLAELSTVLAYDQSAEPLSVEAADSHYVRLAHNRVVIIADIGEAPRLELAGQAHAGALSFELSAGEAPIFVNCGAPGPADLQCDAAARSTASHNTLGLGSKSSGRLLQDDMLERLVGGAPVRSSGAVVARVGTHEGSSTLSATHNGYVAEFGLSHARTIEIGVSADVIDGNDRLAGPGGTLRLARDVPFAIRFHLHPRCHCEAGNGDALVLSLTDGTQWQFTCQGASVSLERSLYYADPAGPAQTRQIVLRGACWGETDVSWRLERLA